MSQPRLNVLESHNCTEWITVFRLELIDLETLVINFWALWISVLRNDLNTTDLSLFTKMLSLSIMLYLINFEISGKRKNRNFA